MDRPLNKGVTLPKKMEHALEKFGEQPSFRVSNLVGHLLRHQSNRSGLGPCEILRFARTIETGLILLEVPSSTTQTKVANENKEIPRRRIESQCHNLFVTRVFFELIQSFFTFEGIQRQEALSNETKQTDSQVKQKKTKPKLSRDSSLSRRSKSIVL